MACFVLQTSVLHSHDRDRLQSRLLVGINVTVTSHWGWHNTSVADSAIGVADSNTDCLQAELMYPHIATTDAKASINTTWLRSLNNRSYHFTDWENENAFKAVIGPRGEKAIINGDMLPSPAGASVHPTSPPFTHLLQTAGDLAASRVS